MTFRFNERVPSDQCLLFAFDENYALPGLVAMHTALLHSPATVGVTVASVGLSAETIGRFHGAAERHDRDLSVFEAERLVSALPSGLPRFSPAAWARIFIDRILPSDCDRIVYLDADTFCRRPIHDLFDVDLGSVPLAAVADPFEPTHEMRGSDYWMAASTDPASGYFNSGVMVVDRASWASQDVTGRALRLIAERKVSTRSVDQDILNAVLRDEWVSLPSEWNTLGSAANAFDHAKIVHFIGERKPWHTPNGGGPFEDEYRSEAASLGWHP